MKNIRLILLVSATALLVLPACKKSAPPPPEGTIQEGGINLELPKLETEFANASPELMHMANEVKTSYFRGQYMNAMMVLDKLSGNPNLTESQKKVVTSVLEGLKKVINARNAAAGSQ